jgi:hypothetical protein
MEMQFQDFNFYKNMKLLAEGSLVYNFNKLSYEKQIKKI